MTRFALLLLLPSAVLADSVMDRVKDATGKVRDRNDRLEGEMGGGSGGTKQGPKQGSKPGAQPAPKPAPAQPAPVKPLPDDPVALVPLLSDADLAMRASAEKALAAMGARAVPALQAALSSPNAETASRARRALGQIQLGAVALVLTPARAVCRAGEAVPLAAVLRNGGTEPVLLLKSLDGSSERLRGPHVWLQVVRDGEPLPRGISERAGKAAQLKDLDFLELAPGSEADPFSEHPCPAFRPDRPGSYEVTLVYALKGPFRTDPAANGPVEDAAAAREGALLRGEIRSNVVTFLVE